MAKNIKGAIDAEQRYLTEKMTGSQPNIYEYLEPYGYTNLNTFHKDKKNYLLKHSGLQMERVYITRESLANWARRATQGESFFCSSDTEDPSLDTVAIVGRSFDEYDKYMAKGVYPVVFDYFRGTVITGIRDFNFCICVPINYELTAPDILQKLQKFIAKKNDNVVVDENDILVNNKKVVGMVAIKNETMSCFIIHISLTDYSELIYELCPPHGGKEPGYIDNITKSEFETEVQSWLQ